MTPNNSGDEFPYDCETAVDLHSIPTADLLSGIDDTLFKDQLQQDQEMSHHMQTTWPAHMDRVPDIEKVDSIYKFEVDINGDSNNWLYEPKLEKIFIKMSSVMNISISYVPHPGQLFLRAMILYTSPDDMHLPVKRCANHREKDHSVNVHHILRSCHTQANYYGNDDGQLFKDRLSVVVPLGERRPNDEGQATEQIGLQFECQNSCTSGINRRPTSIMFTLETYTCELVGKKVVQFKVCSCPKRDAEREMPQKRATADSGSYPKGKKPKYQLTRSDLPGIKVEPQDEMSPPPPNATPRHSSEGVTVTLTLPNADIMCHVLECAYNKVAGEMAKNQSNNVEKYWKCLEHVNKLKEAHTEH